MSNIITSKFPEFRPRRTRKDDWSRRLVREKSLTHDDLILSLIVHDGPDGAQPIESMPGIFRYSLNGAVEQAKIAADLGIPMIAVFPHISIERKDELGSEAWNEDGIIPQFLAEVKAKVPNIGIMCDVALDPYTIHGHDGVVDQTGYMLNDETTEALIRQAMTQARAGADVIAPSDMCDGRIGAIRKELEDEKFKNTKIMAYAAKYASAFYGPYRDAIGSQKALKGDKKTYQMDIMNSDEALIEVALDIKEGADMLMVKPGLPYLDILRRVKDEFRMPTFAFQVSGEYAMLEAAIQNGWLDGERVRIETLECFKRAGADGIITYWAIEAAKKLKD